MAYTKQIRNRIALVALFLLFALPVLLPFFMQNGSFNTKNNGTLIDPLLKLDNTTVQKIQLLENDSLSYSVENLIFRNIWTMMVLSETGCDDSCQQNLYKINQIRLTLINKYEDRLQNIWIVSNLVDESIIKKMLQTYPTLNVYQVTDNENILSNIKSHLNELSLDSSLEGIFFVDYLDYLMMTFDNDINPALIQKDLKLVLKATGSVKSITKENDS